MFLSDPGLSQKVSSFSQRTLIEDLEGSPVGYGDSYAHCLPGHGTLTGQSRKVVKTAFCHIFPVSGSETTQWDHWELRAVGLSNPQVPEIRLSLFRRGRDCPVVPASLLLESPESLPFLGLVYTQRHEAEIFPSATLSFIHFSDVLR